ncbi:MAG TPA: class I SAM-dependent methyltransferase, partial [Acidobacteriaceae bacterium]|nr:class I SAM-dependent methyltransferase [Acidobacteriaceae bacterium]
VSGWGGARVIPNPTERFTGRVESYRRYRPGYPAEAVETLRRACGLSADARVADVAAGTGLLTEVLLDAGFAVTAVEPNEEMRRACATLETKYPKLRVVAGTAEATGLPDASVDLITVAQAMHWFDLEKTRAEFARILRPGGWCAVLYNNRRLSGDAFHDGYEALLREFGVDYLAVKGQHMGRKRLAEFFAPEPMQCATFENAQSFDYAGLEGRILSSSYMPQPGQPRFAEMQDAARRLFAETQRDGAVTMVHDCVMCWGCCPHERERLRRPSS